MKADIRAHMLMQYDASWVETVGSVLIFESRHARYLVTKEGGTWRIYSYHGEVV